MKKVKLSVIIVGYKNVGMVIDCIESINRFNDIGKQMELIVVDNSPDSEVLQVIESLFPSVINIKNENNGFGGGNNVGAIHASGEFLLFLNPDTILVEPIFSFGLQKFAENSQLSMFGVKLVDRQLESNLSFYFWNGAGMFRSICIRLANKFDIYIDGFMYVAGADMFVRRSDFFDCGCFDENIFMYYEEPDLTRRLRSLGKKTAYFKDRKIIHLEGGTTSNSELALRRRLDSAIYYYTKYSLSPKTMLARELRYEKIKAILLRLGIKIRQNPNEKIIILKEYLRFL